MMDNLWFGLLAMVLCLFVQALLVIVAVAYYVRGLGSGRTPKVVTTLGTICTVMLVLVMGNFEQIGIWALLFVLLGEFDNFATALYHSGVNFATLGYGDIVMSEDRRILGPMQAVNGVLMIGVSTAVMMATLQDALKRMDRARHGG